MVLNTFSNPDSIEIDPKDINLEHKLKAIIENDNRVLRIVCNISENPPLIVTAFFDRRMKVKVK